VADTIIIAAYDPAWPAVFMAEQAALAGACSGLRIAIEHIGSTSVPGLGAKPIVDIMIGLHSDTDLNTCIEPIVSLGYEYIGRYEHGEDWMPFRRYFKKTGLGAHGSFHVHVVHADSNFWERQIAFRDHLRTDSQTKHAYEQLKRDLAPRFSDSNDYADAKTDYVEAVLQELHVEPRIRRIQAGDAAILRRVRLAALTDVPDAFGSTRAQTEIRPEGYWTERADRQSSGDHSVAYFAEDNAVPCGLVGGFRSDEDAATASLVSMWVAPTHRRRGVGRLLVDAVVSWARQAGYKALELWVTESNVAANSLYAQAGFQPTGQLQPLPSNPALIERKYRLELESS
jgi:GrpB-like predicted nucleotidyltransferase (UPF0157 family)/GNAT superfamily N-acetyltransferase